MKKFVLLSLLATLSVGTLFYLLKTDNVENEINDSFQLQIIKMRLIDTSGCMKKMLILQRCTD